MMRARTIVGTVVLLVISGCTQTQLQSAELQAQAICTDIGQIEADAGPLNVIPIVSTTEGYLGQACTAASLASADLSFLAQFKANLAATVASVKPRVPSP